MKHLVCICIFAALAIPGCDQADTSQKDPVRPAAAMQRTRDETASHTQRDDRAAPKPGITQIYDPSTVDQAPGWHEAQHPYTWPPDDKFWDIRRFKVRDPRADDETMELFPDFPRQDRIVQKRAFSLKPEDFDAHCAAEEKAGRWPAHGGAP